MTADRLADAVGRERARLFVGRQAELIVLDGWLADPLAETRIVFVTGMGGVGKSALLQEAVRRARVAAAAPAALWMDGRACGRSPAGFLDYLRVVLARLPVRDGGPTPALQPSGDPLTVLSDLASRERALLAIDNYDDLSLLDGWLREEVAAHLPLRGALLLAACGPAPAPGWQTDPAWRQRVVHLPLSPLTMAEAGEYLERLGVPASDRDGLIRAAGGQPRALAIGAGALVGRPHPVGTAPLAPNPGASGVTGGAFADPGTGVPAAEVRTALALLAHPKRLDTAPLARRLGCTGRELQQRLRDLLDTPTPPGPLTRPLQVVLGHTFGDEGGGPTSAAARLHMSRATYYRRLREALDAAAEALGHPL